MRKLKHNATLDKQQGQILLGLPLWCSYLKDYKLQAGGNARIQPYTQVQTLTKLQKIVIV